jgi:PAS domain S-box-containing protein
MDRSPAARYSIAVVVASLAVAIRVLIDPWLGHRALFVTVFATGVLLAWTFGLGPALAGLGTGAAGIALALLHPVGSLAIARADDQVTLIAFLVTGVLTALLVDATRRSRIRAQRSAELALHGREVLENVTDNTSVMLAQCSRELRYQFVNRACAEFLGRPRERIVGQDMRTVLGEEAFEAIRPQVAEVLRGEVVEFETWLPNPQTGPRFLHSRYVPDQGPAGGEVRGFFASITDVTEQKRAERVLREADRRKDEFLATLGHELRNPLAPIANAVQLLQLKGPPDPELFAARDMIARQVRQLARLIDDLLDISRITLGKLELRTESIELAEVVSLAVETTRPVLRSRGHDLLVLLPPETVWLRADPARLAQVLANLLDNAAKYSDRPGRITLSASVEARAQGPGRLDLRVKDEGLGIAAEFLPRLFDKFTQAIPKPGAVPSGMGLGLALVRGLVEMHGGTVRALSEGPGRGSEFVIELPVSDAPPGAALAPGPAACAAPLARASDSRRILVVDDNHDSADSLAQLLRVLGHDVEAVHGGHEAVAAAERYRPQLVLMDLGMPELDGYEACRLIREKPWGRGMMLVAQTGWGQDQDRLRAQEAGFDSHLVKPVDAKSLSALLASLPASG